MRRPTTKEYWDQVSSYVQMALDVLRTDPDKLTEMIDSLDSLPEPAINEVLAFSGSDAVTGLPDARRLPIWSKMSSLVRKHRRFAAAKWALPAGIVERIDHAASALAPKDPMVKHRVLFGANPWSLYDDDEGDWQTSQERLSRRQLDAVAEINSIGGVDGLLAFAVQVENPSQVGFALGKLASVNVVTDLLPRLVLPSESKLQQMVQGFVWALFQRDRWFWFDELDLGPWSKDEIAQVLSYLPFQPETWTRANQLLSNDGKEYWTRVPIHPHQRSDAAYIAVDALLKNGRPAAAVACLAAYVNDQLPLDPNRAMTALRRAATSHEGGNAIDTHVVEIIIKALQDDPNADKRDLMMVEWAYLPVLEHSHLVRAKTLNGAIGTDPQFFCQLIGTIFRSDKQTDTEPKPEPTEETRAVAKNAYRLLDAWSTVPGTEPGGTISAPSLTSWINEVKGALDESGHLDVGLTKAGEVFIHSPADPDGLFISHAVAAVLNRQDMDRLRRGYEIAVYNSRGAHVVDPTGAPEKALSATFSQRADAAENAGYHRLAVTLRLIAGSYTRDADRVIANSAAERR